MDADTLTIPEAAARLGIGERTARRYVAEGRFPVPVLRIGSCKRVSRRQLDAFINGDQAQAS